MNARRSHHSAKVHSIRESATMEGGRATTITILGGAAALGLVIGVGSLMAGRSDPHSVPTGEQAESGEPLTAAPFVSAPRPKMMTAADLDAQQPSVSGGLRTERRPVPSFEADSASSVSFPNCRAAWAAGAAPIYRGQPGYSPRLDGDGDGIACEPFRGRR